MRTLVLHHTLNSAGGGERVSLATIEALKELGKGKVDLGTVEKTDWKKVKNTFGEVTLPDKEMNILPFKLSLFGIYQRSLTGLYVYKYRKKYDLIINTHGDVMPAFCDVTYMHFPTFTLLKQPTLLIKHKDFIKYRKNLFWRIYFIPYEFIQTKLVKKYLEHSLILTNSRFSQSIIKKWTGKNAQVVYPPVEVEKFYFRSDSRDNIIVTCSRFTPEKGLNIIPEIASKIPEGKFYIFGSTSKTSWEVISEIKKAINKFKIKNIYLRPNASLKEMLTIYRKAKIYLHTMINEHFGLSIVEAMASGLVPLIHKSGGPYMDILDCKQGIYGFYYKTEDEAVNIIKNLLSDESTLKKIREKAIERSFLFNKNAFKLSFIKAIKHFIE
ncbi:MAG: glycosyltransferase [Candidatus Bathyarchaeia archaeon]